MGLRVKRLSSQLQNDLGSILQEYQNESIISVTNVSVTPDLSVARVYVSIYSAGGGQKQVFEYLQKHNRQIRGKLAQKIRNHIKRIPELQFFLDDSAEYVDRIENLFQQIKEDRKKSDE